MIRTLVGLLEGAVIVCIMLFVIALMLGLAYLGFIEIFHNEPSELTKACRDGKLYEVTHEGNITIFDRSAFMTCEETK